MKTPQIKTQAEALRYLQLCRDNNEACKYGHFGCAAFEGGPCGNEIAAEFKVDGYEPPVDADERTADLYAAMDEAPQDGEAKRIEAAERTTTTYTPQELNSLARFEVRGLGRFIRYELRVSNEATNLRAYFVRNYNPNRPLAVQAVEYVLVRL